LFFSLLNEKQRRLYAGLESFKLGHGGDHKIANLFAIDTHTVAKGRQELFSGDVQMHRVRKKGAGRKPVEKNPSGHRKNKKTAEIRNSWRFDKRLKMVPKDY
jgi:hypothetical protein